MILSGHHFDSRQIGLPVGPFRRRDEDQGRSAEAATSGLRTQPSDAMFNAARTATV